MNYKNQKLLLKIILIILKHIYLIYNIISFIFIKIIKKNYSNSINKIVNWKINNY